MEIILPAFNALVFFLLAALHLFWLINGKGMNATIPTDSNGRKIFRPGRLITFMVALGLLFFALSNIAYAGWLDLDENRVVIRYGILVIAIIFFLRAIGDFRYIGISKRGNRSLFAKWDTALYTPLCLILAITHMILFFSVQD